MDLCTWNRGTCTCRSVYRSILDRWAWDSLEECTKVQARTQNVGVDITYYITYWTSSRATQTHTPYCFPKKSQMVPSSYSCRRGGTPTFQCWADMFLHHGMTGCVCPAEGKGEAPLPRLSLGAPQCAQRVPWAGNDPGPDSFSKSYRLTICFWNTHNIIRGDSLWICILSRWSSVWEVGTRRIIPVHNLVLSQVCLQDSVLYCWPSFGEDGHWDPHQNYIL